MGSAVNSGLRWFYSRLPHLRPCFRKQQLLGLMSP